MLTDVDNWLEENSDLVRYILFHRFSIKPEYNNYEDLFNIGLHALYKARQSFDPEKSAWSTWAYKVIWGNIADTIRTKGRPYRYEKTTSPMNEGDNGFQGFRPEYRAIAEQQLCYNTSTELEDSNDQFTVENLPVSATIKRMIKQHFVEGKTYRELGPIYGVSHEAVRKRVVAALDKLRDLGYDKVYQLLHTA